MPEEVSFDAQMDTRRFKDITLPEEDLGFQAAEQLLEDWGPIPPQYLYQLTTDEFEMVIGAEFEEDLLQRKHKKSERAELRVLCLRPYNQITSLALPLKY
jgi:hypothetical protein